jgi:predicted nucleic acid-binding protein
MQLIKVVAPAESGVRLPVCTDKDDQKFLELARDANATILITKDKALLKLARKRLARPACSASWCRKQVGSKETGQANRCALS